MASVFFVAPKEARQNATVRSLQDAGHRVVTAEPRYPDFKMGIEAMRPPPDVIVVEAGKQPFLAREAASALADTKAYGQVPIVFYNVRPEDVDATTKRVATARITDLASLRDVIGRMSMLAF